MHDRLYHAEAHMRKTLLNVSLEITNLIAIRNKVQGKVKLLEERRLKMEKEAFVPGNPGITKREKRKEKKKAQSLEELFNKTLEKGG